MIAGDKPYLMGDKLCEEDCIMFGFVVQTVYHPHGMEGSKKLLEGILKIIFFTIYIYIVLSGRLLRY